VPAQFGRRCCRETIRRALHRLKLSWKKPCKRLGRAKPEQREAFVAGSAGYWMARAMSVITWSIPMRRISIRTPIPAMAGANAASASRPPHPRPA
jgi:hypothetical protein